MTANAFAVSRRLVDKGVDKSVADAVAEEIVTHSDETAASKADVARLEGKINALEVMVKINLGLTVGFYVGIGVYFLVKLLGAGG